MFIIALMLQNFNLEKPVTFKINALDYMAANMLSQLNEEENLHSVIFFPTKCF